MFAPASHPAIVIGLDHREYVRLSFVFWLVALLFSLFDVKSMNYDKEMSTFSTLFVLSVCELQQRGFVYFSTLCMLPACELRRGRD